MLIIADHYLSKFLVANTTFVHSASCTVSLIFASNTYLRFTARKEEDIC